MSSTEVSTIDAAAKYPALADGNDVLDALRESLGPGERLGVGDLTRVKMPSGGGRAFDVPGIGDEVASVQSITGVVVYQRPTRAYWHLSMEEGSGADPPDCSSSDGYTGVARTEYAPLEVGSSQACETCPLAQFGSDGDGRGQACKQMTQLFVVTEEAGFLPLVLTLPPTSLGAWKKLKIGVAGKLRVPYRHVEVVIGLEQRKGGPDAKVTYSAATFRVVGVVPPEQRAVIDAFAEALIPIVAAVPVVDERADGGDPVGVA